MYTIYQDFVLTLIHDFFIGTHVGREPGGTYTNNEEPLLDDVLKNMVKSNVSGSSRRKLRTR